MGDKRNFAALDWVIGEIAETLKEARQALEAYVEDSRDSTRIRFCLTHIHQVHGSLQMVEFHGAALLAEEMEHTAQAIMENTVASIPEAQEVLMRSLLQLPIYLEHARTAREDNPARVMPLLNDMRAVRKQSYLSETNLFSPDLSQAGIVSGNKHPVLQSREKLLPVLKKLREMYQYAAASVLRGIKVDENLSYIEKVISRLELLSAGTRCYPIWEVSAALIDALKRDELELTVAVKGLLRFIAKELRVLGENAPGAMDLAPRESLLKNLLYYVGRAEDGSAKVAKVKAKYGLAKNGDEPGLDDMLQTPDADAIRSVVAALQEEIGSIKHSLDLSLSGQLAAGDLKDILPTAKRIADTLAVLGIGDLRKTMLEQAASLESMSESNKVDEEQLIATANRIVEIEQRLKAISASAGKHANLSQINERDVEIDAAKMAVLNECAAGLQKCKEAVVDYISSQWDKQHLNEVSGMLNDIRGGLNMIPLPRAAAVVNSCALFVHEKLMEGLGHPAFDQLELLADAVAGVEYYLERLAANLSEDAESTLDMTEESVAKLGYAVGSVGLMIPKRSDEAEEQSAAKPRMVSVTSPSNFISDPTDFLTADKTSRFDEEDYDVPTLSTVEDFSSIPQSSAIEDSQPAILSAEEIEADEDEAITASADEDAGEEDASEEIVLHSEESSETGDETITETFSTEILATSHEDEYSSAEEDDSSAAAVYEEDLPAEAAAIPSAPPASVSAKPAAPQRPAAKREERESDIDDEIIEIFIEEANEVLETLAEYFPKWKAKESDQDSLVIVRRAFHTLKGSGRMVEALDIGELAWSIENMLNRVIDHTISVKPHVFHIVEAVMDAVPHLISAFEARSGNPIPDVTEQYMAWAHEIAEGKFPRELADPLPPLGEPEGQHSAAAALAADDDSQVESSDYAETLQTEISDYEDSIEAEAEAEREAESEFVSAQDDEDDSDELNLVTHPDYYEAQAREAESAARDEAAESLDEAATDPGTSPEKSAAQLLAEEESEEDRVLQEIFSQEAITHLATVDKFVRDMEEEAPIYAMPSDELQRALHTLKGSAKMAQVWPIAEITEPLEHFAKELISYQVRVNEDILQLIRDAAEYTRYGIEQIGKGKPVVIEKIPQFVARTQELRDLHVGHLALPKDEHTGAFKVDPRMLAIVMAEEMVRLLEADRHLNQWQQDGFCDSEIGRLLDELKVLEEGARQANLPEMANLTASLRAAHKLALANNHLADSDFFRLMHKGHDALLDMVDVVAAGQNVQAVPPDIARSLADFLARDPDEGLVPEPESTEAIAYSFSDLPSANDEHDSFRADADFIDDHLHPLAEAELVEVEGDGEEAGVYEAAEFESSSLIADSFDSDQIDADEAEIIEFEPGETLAGTADLASNSPTLNEIDVSEIDEAEYETAELSDFFLTPAEPSAASTLASEQPEEAIHFELPAEGEGDEELLLDLGDQVDLSSDESGTNADEEIDYPTLQPLAFDDEAEAVAASDHLIAEDSTADEETAADEALITDDMISDDMIADDSDEESWFADSADDTEDTEDSGEVAEFADEELAQPVDELVEEQADDLTEEPDAPSWAATSESSHFEPQSRSSLDAAQEVASVPEYEDTSAQDEDEAPEVGPGPTIPGLLDVIDSTSADFDRDILDIFLEEADELIESMDEAIHSWERNWADTEGVEEIKRVLHTLKGGARLSGLKRLGDLVHDYETMIIEKGDDPAAVNAALFSGIHQYQDKMLNAIKGIKTFMEGDYEVAYPAPTKASPTREKAMAAKQAKVEAPSAPASLSESKAPAASLEHTPEVSDDERFADDEDHDTASRSESSTKANIVRFEPKVKERSSALDTDDDLSGGFSMPSISGGVPTVGPGGGGAYAAVAQALKKAQPQEVVKVSAELLEELVNLAGETSINRSRLEQYVNDFSFALDEVDSTLTRLQDQLRRLDMETEAQVLFRQEQMEASDQFDPLEMDRYSHLQQLSRSLIESASDLMDLKSQLGEKLKTTETLLLQQSRINTTLQEGLMRSRMVPFSRLVPRLRRIVRQVATELGKNVSFELDNVEGELDRSVLERMVPPFEHMLRNAVDHGIEMPEARIAAGKSETGRIVLTLAREGGDVLIRLADDGRGIDLKRVRAKAIERGLMSAEAELSDHDIMQFILHAGFSTAENVTQISGRGVGMDVVHAEIKQLGGSVTINSAWGKGTEFIIRLPFTLSVNRALMVSIGNDQYAVPLSSIEGIVRVSPFELEHYYAHPEAKFEYARETYDVRYLGGLLYRDAKPALSGQSLPLPVLLVRSAEHAMALQVDAVMGSREIVVKSLGIQFSAVTGLSGATVMGDGSVVIILDPHALVRQEIARANLQLEGKAPLRQLEEKREEARIKHIMVVDDSVTVRKVTTRFLEREGFEVSTAKDGMDALRLLQEQVPDLMLLDIEMPRMDGFEVARTVRSTKRWEHIPIIMITSRTGDKHREHAMSLGVNNYLGKPYQEDILLDAISEILEPNHRQV